MEDACSITSGELFGRLTGSSIKKCLRRGLSDTSGAEEPKGKKPDVVMLVAFLSSLKRPEDAGGDDIDFRSMIETVDEKEGDSHKEGKRKEK